MGVSEFFRTIQWGPTLQVALMRVGIASLLLPIIMLFIGDIPTTGKFFLAILGWLIFLVAALVVALPVIAIARAGVPLIGLLALPAWVVVIANPFIWLLWKFKPELVPVGEFSLFSPPVLAIFDQ